MKSVEREEARRLRREQGLSVKEICRALGVAKSSVSVWMRDIELREEQKLSLYYHHGPRYRGRKNGGEKTAIYFRELRRQYQDSGRIKAREGYSLHLAGCML